jgi:murein DD-endopeptidase MepM/ murein hydrolase activator NlpD
VSFRRNARVASRVSPRYLFLLFLLAAGVAAVGYVAVRMATAGAPRISLAAPFEKVGRGSTLAVDVADRHGLRAVEVVLEQGGRAHTLQAETYDPPRPAVEVRFSPATDARVKLQEGSGRLRVTARNASWGNFFRGRTASLEQDFVVRLAPPRLEVLTGQHYVNQGGCDMVVYRVRPADAQSGVLVGERFFPGFPLPGSSDPSVRFAVFAFPYDLPPSTPVRLRARDEVGNESLAGFWLKVFPRNFRTRTLEVEDAFLAKVVPEIMSQTPSLADQGDVLKNYLAINGGLRQVDSDRLGELARASKPQFLWQGPFTQLAGSQVEAQFADHRRYMHRGLEVDRQDHLGYDLATSAAAPVTAANGGVVVLAEYFGIYGNAVVIDHGFGLLSLYGHLSRLDVAPGAAVAKGQTLGASGATGLAAGDHLHFSMVLHGEQVDAREWWDPHWLQDRVSAKLLTFAAAPASPAAPQ